jgi:hypothetical protein
MRREVCIMGTYYKHAEHITRGYVGRRLDTYMYHQAKEQLRRGEHLYVLIQFTTHSAALCVDDAREFYEFSRLLDPYEFYALSEAAHSRSV